MARPARGSALAFAALIGYGLCPESGTAAGSASASIDKFKIEIVDLDLNDGIEAGYTVSNPVTRFITFVGGDPGFPDQHAYEDRILPGWGPATNSLSFAGAVGEASAGSVFGDLSASGTFPGHPGFANTLAWRYGDMTIRPNTRLTFTADVSVSGQAGPPTTARGESKVFFLLTDSSVQEPVFEYRFGRDFGGGSSADATDRLDLSVETSVGLMAGLQIGTNIDVRSDRSVTPIPEPETYALMLAGLGALGLWCGCGRRRAEPHDDARVA